MLTLPYQRFNSSHHASSPKTISHLNPTIVNKSSISNMLQKVQMHPSLQQHEPHNNRDYYNQQFNRLYNQHSGIEKYHPHNLRKQRNELKRLTSNHALTETDSFDRDLMDGLTDAQIYNNNKITNAVELSKLQSAINYNANVKALNKISAMVDKQIKERAKQSKILTSIYFTVPATMAEVSWYNVNQVTKGLIQRLKSKGYYAKHKYPGSCVIFISWPTTLI